MAFMSIIGDYRYYWYLDKNLIMESIQIEFIYFAFCPSNNIANIICRTPLPVIDVKILVFVHKISCTYFVEDLA